MSGAATPTTTTADATTRGNRLEAQIRLPDLAQPLHVDLVAEPGDVVAVVGPNGAGKTTLLRALAGLLPMPAGTVRCGPHTWSSPRARRAWSPQQRNVAMVFQSALLMPHLDVLDNVAFGPRSRGRSRTDARRCAASWLERVGVGDLASRRVTSLSGGQAQRVSIARALATDPSLLLLDEPLAGLDVSVAMALRFELADHLTDFDAVAVLVTHDPVDTATMATRVVVLDAGRVAQVGTPEEVAQSPLTEHVARLVGLNVVRGIASGTAVHLDSGGEVVTTTVASGRVNAAFSPAAVTLALEEPTGSPRNRWRGTVRSVAPHGAAVRVHVASDVTLLADVTPESAARLHLVPGRDVWASVKATEVRVYGAGAAGDSAPLTSPHV